MEDFAAAAMMRLVAAGLAWQGVAAPAPKPVPGPHVPLQDKRAALAAIAAAHGPAAVLRIADALPSMPAEPVLRVLTLSRDAGDLLERWSRLERFVHSRHRVDWRDEGSSGLVLRHRSRLDGEPPTPEEDLLVFGVLTVLCEMIGGGAVEAGPDGAAPPWRAGGRWVEAAAVGDLAPWRLRIAPSPHPARDDPPPQPGGVAAACFAAVSGDPAARWTVAALSRICGMTPRTLQRRLVAEGARFSGVLLAARLHAAAAMLDASGARLSEVAYACGFADQAHLTRAFRRSAGLTPATYRGAFSR